ncbi:hypothetical protein BH11PAT3_BH11PAT3_3360 [soil metagenome]
MSTQSIKNRTIKTSAILALVFVFFIGISGGYMYAQSKATTPPVSEILRENSSKYRFINPIYLAGDRLDSSSSEYKPLNDELTTFSNDAKRSEEVSDVSIYFRDLYSGRWTGVNENDKYAPGSMLKVAVLLGYLKLGEQKPTILDEKYDYAPTRDPGQFFPPQKLLPEGKERVGDLIKNMIINSDNTATLLLIDKNQDAVNSVYGDLRLPLPEGAIDFMSAKSYSVLWRVLYNGTYLTKALSEQVGTLLSLTTFKDGLVAGIPQGVRIAHKFGEHTDVKEDEAPVHELHDCGIIYPEGKNPYFLCVMTRGANFDTLKTVIQSASKLVYENVMADDHLLNK